MIPQSTGDKTAAHWAKSLLCSSNKSYLFSDVWMFLASFLHHDGSCHTTRAVLKSYKNGHGDREISIRIFSVCSPPTLAHRGSAKDVSNSQTGGSQDSRKQLPRSVWTTHKASEELFPGRHKGRISYVTGWVHTIHVKHRGPSVGNALLWRNGLRLKPCWCCSAKQNSPERQMKNCHLFMEEN